MNSLSGPKRRESAVLIIFCPGNEIDSHIIYNASVFPPAAAGPLPEILILYLLGRAKPLAAIVA
jgi:hypothetical protein